MYICKTFRYTHKMQINNNNITPETRREMSIFPSCGKTHEEIAALSPDIKRLYGDMAMAKKRVDVSIEDVCVETRSLSASKRLLFVYGVSNLADLTVICNAAIAIRLIDSFKIESLIESFADIGRVNKHKISYVEATTQVDVCPETKIERVIPISYSLRITIWAELFEAAGYKARILR